MVSTVLVLAAVEGPAAFQWSNVSQGNGIAIAITGMLIVFVALTLISSAIAALPHVLKAIAPYLPVSEHAREAPPPAESLPADVEKVVAAIGMVLHTEMQKTVDR